MLKFITFELLQQFRYYLKNEERENSTIEKYLQNIQSFANWLQNREVTKENLTAYKEYLIMKKYNPKTINGILSAINKFLVVAGWGDIKVKYLRIQRQLFRSSGRELTKAEYMKLLNKAQELGKERLSLLMQTICSTGIRVSELKCITVEAVKTGKAEISLKGKIRTILLTGKLCKKLLKYTKGQKITSGEIFLTRSSRGLGRKQIWAEMKALCKKAGIESGKVFPHNPRHLFARTFYKVCKDVAKLADVLGHSSIETTRIYLISTGAEHLQTLNKLQLLI
jgi:Site-specific recombinase XerD